jgi:periplasmic protein TonB
MTAALAYCGGGEVNADIGNRRVVYGVERLAWPSRAWGLGPRQAFFVVVLALHALVVGLLLMPRARERLTVLFPSIEATLVSDSPSPTQIPPLPPLALERPHIDVIVPNTPIILPPSDAPTAAPPVPAVSAAVAAPAKAAAGPAEPVTPPRFDAAYLKNPAPVYPMASRRMHERGTVLMRVRVSQEGAAAEVLLEHTSGSQRLDQAAMDAVRSWRFVPAHRGTEAVEAWVLVPVEFALQY